MKTLQRMQLDKLKKEMPMLDQEELGMVIGGDRYCFDKSGHLYNTIADDNVNEIYVDGAKKPYTIVDSGTTIHAGDKEHSGVSIDGADKKLFEYMADNTDVEWGYSYNGNGKSYTGKLNTDHDHSGVEVSPHKGYENFVHNHPGGARVCDDEDFNAMYTFTYPEGKYTSQYNYKNFLLYTKDQDGKHYDLLDRLERVYNHSGLSNW